MAVLVPILQNLNPLRQFFALLIISIICLSVVSMLTALCAPWFGLQLDDLIALNNKLDKPSAINYLKFSQVVSGLALFILPPFIFMLLRGEKPFQALKLNQTPPLRLLLGAMLLMLVQVPIINATASFNSNIGFPADLEWLQKMLREMESTAGAITEAFLKITSTGDLLMMLFIMAFLPAIGEELLFRSTLQPLFSGMFRNHHVGIWFTAFLFSFIHFQFFGFIPRFLIGGFLGYLFYFSGNTWIPAAAHFANNAMAVIASWLFNKGLIKFSPDDLGTTAECSIALFLLVGGMFWFIRSTPQRREV
jgi:membrane protease YdiL (CAAX protease family)